MSGFYWTSWYQPTQDERPLSFPPNSAILGWWCSGYTADDTHTLCAMVQAENEEAAKAAVLIDWPEAERWRFCDEKESPALLGNRFQLTEWMVQRFKAAADHYDAETERMKGEGK